MKNIEYVAQDLINRSVVSAGALLQDLSYESEKERNFYLTHLVLEFVYLYLHLISRELVISDGEDRMKVLDDVRSTVQAKAIDILYEDLPKDLLVEAWMSYISGANASEIQFSTCTELLNQDEPFADSAVFSLFGKNVLKLANAPENFEVMMKAISLALHDWFEIKPSVV